MPQHIFERSVQDSTSSCPAHGMSTSPVLTRSNSISLMTRERSIVCTCHRNAENLVAPALDATAQLKGSLENVEMVYSRKSSLVGLNMALSRSSSMSMPGRSASFVGQPTSPSSGSGSVSGERPQVLRFYSFADVLHRESCSQKRPSFMDPFGREECAEDQEDAVESDDELLIDNVGDLVRRKKHEMKI